MSRDTLFLNGNSKRHHDPPLRVNKLLCFGKKEWVEIRKIVGEKRKRRKSFKRRGKKKIESRPGNVRTEVNGNGRARYFEFDIIGRRRWWEAEKWVMVADPENPYGDTTREEQIRVNELLKGMRKH